MRSARLWWRGSEPDDAERISRWMNHTAVRRYLDHRVFPFGQAAERRFLDGHSSITRGRDDVMFVVGVDGEDAPIAATGLHGFNWIARSAEFGILIDADHHRRGYGREVSAEMLRYAFDDLNLHRVTLRVRADHDAGRRCYQSVGYVEEGVGREEMYADGRYVDCIHMAMLASEWRALRSAPA